MPTTIPRASVRAAEAEINVTPMIDVLLVLLVIFMLAQSATGMLPAQLPPERAETASTRPDLQIVLEVAANGRYLVNAQPVPAAELGTLLRSALSARSAKLVFIQAAAESTYQEVVTAMDIAKGAGAQAIAFMPRRGR